MQRPVDLCVIEVLAILQESDEGQRRPGGGVCAPRLLQAIPQLLIDRLGKNGLLQTIEHGDTLQVDALLQLDPKLSFHILLSRLHSLQLITHGLDW